MRMGLSCCFREALPALLAGLFLLAPAQIPAKTIPATRMRAVDAATGEPLEMVYIMVVSHRESKAPVLFQFLGRGGGDVLTTHHGRWFLKTDDGWFTFPEIKHIPHRGCGVLIWGMGHPTMAFDYKKLMQVVRKGGGAGILQFSRFAGDKPCCLDYLAPDATAESVKFIVATYEAYLSSIPSHRALDAYGSDLNRYYNDLGALYGTVSKVLTKQDGGMTVQEKEQGWSMLMKAVCELRIIGERAWPKSVAEERWKEDALFYEKARAKYGPDDPRVPRSPPRLEDYRSYGEAKFERLLKEVPGLQEQMLRYEMGQRPTPALQSPTDTPQGNPKQGGPASLPQPK